MPAYAASPWPYLAAAYAWWPKCESPAATWHGRSSRHVEVYSHPRRFGIDHMDVATRADARSAASRSRIAARETLPDASAAQD